MHHRFVTFVDGTHLVGVLGRHRLRVNGYEAFFRHVFEAAVRIWKGTFDGTAPPAQLQRVKWYEVGSVDDWHHDETAAEAALRDAFDRDPDVQRSYMALAGQKLAGRPQAEVALEAWRMCFGDVRRWYDERRGLVDWFRRFHRAIEGRIGFVDLVECGHWKLDLLHRKVLERGLDIRLAVDMVTLLDQYDVALLLTTDAGTVPAVDYLKARGRHVGVVDILGGSPPEEKGGAPPSRLKAAADFVVPLYETDLVERRLVHKHTTATPVPPPLAASVAGR